jgi:hypothetical protein
MDERVTKLLSGMIETERSRRAVSSDKALVAVRDQFPNALGHGRYPLLLDDVSAAEYEARGQAWLGLASRVTGELGLEWTAERARSVGHILRMELGRDWEEIYARLERFARGSRGVRMDRLDAAKTRTEHHLEHELDLLVLKADHTRLPLVERLAADRYGAVLGAWRKAHALMDQVPPDLANAAKEAVGAVETLARIVIGEPNAKLGDAIKTLRSSGKVRAPLLKGIEELWGWTSGEPGVRHGALEGSLEPADVQYCFTLTEAALGLLLAADAA